MTTSCLDADALAALLESETANAMAEYADHLETCAQCQQTVAELSERRWREQEVVHCLQPALERAAGSEPALTRVMAQLKNELTLLHNADDEASLEAEDALAILNLSERPELLGTLGGYEVQEIIGRGGMGVVFKALDPVLNRSVAIKVMAAAAASGPVARRRFIREAQAAAAVCHEHIVTVHGVHEARGLPYLVMQFVAGESLQDKLDRMGPLEVTEIVRIAQQTAAGLAAAHAQGLIHRDIKPANLLLEEGQDRVRITDFGLARTTQDVGLTQAGVVTGTPEYMAPEQARGDPVDHRADLFSLGCVLYAMCTGRPPFRAAAPLAVLRQITDQVAAPVRSLNPQVPAWLACVVELLLAKDPADRIQTADEVARLLEAYRAHLRDPLTMPAPELPASAVEEALQLDQGGARTPPRWLLGLMACLGAGLTLLGLHASGYLLPGAALAIEQNSGTGTLQFDFRGKAPDGQLLDYVGPDAYEYCKPEAEGLRVSLPPNREHPWPVGVRLSFPLQGDCEITASYEVLKADRPASGYGVGATLYIVADGPAKKAAMVGWLNRPEGSGYICDFNRTNALGKRQFKRNPFSSEVQSGKLRLVRSGSWVSYQVAEPGASEFRELQKVDFGTEDLVEVRVACDTGNSTSPGEVRIADFEVRGTNLPATSPLGKGWWLLTALGIAVLITVLGLWFYVRRNVRTESIGGVDAEASQSPTTSNSRKMALLVATALLLCAAAGVALSWPSSDAGVEAGTTASPSPPAAAGRTGFAMLFALGLALVILLGGGLALWHARRKGAIHPAPGTLPAPEPANPPLTFACSGCGKRLKVRAALAGKKVRCPQCGQAVAVPLAVPDAAIRPAL